MHGTKKNSTIISQALQSQTLLPLQSTDVACTCIQVNIMPQTKVIICFFLYAFSYSWEYFKSLAGILPKDRPMKFENGMIGWRIHTAQRDWLKRKLWQGVVKCGMKPYLCFDFVMQNTPFCSCHTTVHAYYNTGSSGPKPVVRLLNQPQKISSSLVVLSLERTMVTKVISDSEHF